MNKIIAIEIFHEKKWKLENDIMRKINEFRAEYKINIEGVRMITHIDTGDVLGIEIKIKK